MKNKKTVKVSIDSGKDVHGPFLSVGGFRYQMPSIELARILAAAPELLAALTLAREIINRFQPSDKILWSEITLIQDAIAKATGGDE